MVKERIENKKYLGIDKIKIVVIILFKWGDIVKKFMSYLGDTYTFKYGVTIYSWFRVFLYVFMYETTKRGGKKVRVVLDIKN